MTDSLTKVNITHNTSYQMRKMPVWFFAAGENEAAFSVAPVVFQKRGGESFVVVGTAKGLTFHPRHHEGCFLHVYRYVGR